MASGCSCRDEGGGGADRRGGIAPFGLEQDGGGRAGFGQRRGDEMGMVGAGDDDRRSRRRPDRRCAASVRAKVEAPSTSGRNGLGLSPREAGHRRVPAPPHIMTGMIMRFRPFTGQHREVDP